MYALFKDGKVIAEAYSLLRLWTDIVNNHPFIINGSISNTHFTNMLDKGYTIEEVKE